MKANLAIGIFDVGLLTNSACQIPKEVLPASGGGIDARLDLQHAIFITAVSLYDD